jgi:hypothetical protein
LPSGIKNNKCYHLLILVALSLCIGTYLIATTLIITKDGVLYIQSAQKFTLASIDAIKSEYFGYLFIIFAAHKLVGLFIDHSSLYGWIYTAQGITLLCRTLSIICLYFIGKILVGRRNSFLSLLILVFLPYPAKFGSDVLRDWPHILFLSISLLLLIRAGRSEKLWMFAAAGFVSGIGFMIRPECVQTVIYGILWLLIGIFLPEKKTSKVKMICALLLLVTGFAIPATPYIKAKGLPDKLKKVVNYSQQTERGIKIEQQGGDGHHPICQTAGLANDTVKTLVVLISKITEDLMYFFMPPLIIGFYYCFRKLRNILLPERFFVLSLVVLYTTMMILLHINYSYISRRHSMPIVVFTIFYVPIGLRIISRRISSKFTGKKLYQYKTRQKYFFILITLGLAICAAKIVEMTLPEAEKRGYVDTAAWLKQNTAVEDLIGVPDYRLSFYAEREGLLYEKEIPGNVKYAVVIIKFGNNEPLFSRTMKKEYSTWLNKRGRNEKIVVYKLD